MNGVKGMAMKGKDGCYHGEERKEMKMMRKRRDMKMRMNRKMKKGGM